MGIIIVVKCEIYPLNSTFWELNIFTNDQIQLSKLSNYAKVSFYNFLYS